MDRENDMYLVAARNALASARRKLNGSGGRGHEDHPLARELVHSYPSRNCPRRATKITSLAPGFLSGAMTASKESADLLSVLADATREADNTVPASVGGV